MNRDFWSRDPKSIQNVGMNLMSPSRPNDERTTVQLPREEAPKYDRQFSVLQGQIKRIKRISILSLLLIVLATIVHIVQFFVPPAKINQQYAKIVDGNRDAVHSAPECGWLPQPPCFAANLRAWTDHGHLSTLSGLPRIAILRHETRGVTHEREGVKWRRRRSFHR